ncbi:MAG: hypothetical protein JWM11_6710 [Planctomycetaceae bacterium]|nr:hypothetical protein [Planctomycetaceae bacterium]
MFLFYHVRPLSCECSDSALILCLPVPTDAAIQTQKCRLWVIAPTHLVRLEQCDPSSFCAPDLLLSVFPDSGDAVNDSVAISINGYEHLKCDRFSTCLCSGFDGLKTCPADLFAISLENTTVNSVFGPGPRSGDFGCENYHFRRIRLSKEC